MSLLLRCIAGAILGLAMFSYAPASLNWELVEWNGLPLVPSAVTADGSRYVAAATDIVMSSTNGKDWIIEHQGSGLTITCLAIWNGGIYAGTREGRILFQPASESDWTVSPVIFAPPEGETFPISIQQIVVGNDRAVATSRTSFSVSLDGTTWSDAAPLPEDIAASPGASAFGNGLFMIASYRDASFAISPNGTEWAKVNLVGFANILSGQLQHYNGIWLASVERAGGQSRALVSTDGSTWEEASLPFQNVSSFATSLEGFAVVGRNRAEDAYLARSTDGKTWTSTPIEAADPRGPQYGPRTLHEPFVAKGPAGYVAVEHRSGTVELTTSFVSPDGINWAPVNLPPDEIPPYASITLVGFEGAFFHDGFGDNGPLFSEDGRVWTPLADLIDEHVELVGVLAIAEVETGLFLLTDNRVLLHSNDGESWAKLDYSVEGFSQPLLTRLASFGGYLYAMATLDVRFEHFLVKSHDGVTWTSASDTEFSRGHQLLPTSDGLIVHSANGSGYLTTDGVTWENIESTIKTSALRSSGSMIYGRSIFGEIEQWSLSDGYRIDSPFEASQGRRIHSEVVEMIEDGRYFIVAYQFLHAGTDLGSLELIKSPLYIQNIIVRGDKVIATSDAGILTATLRPKDYIWDQNSNRYTTWVESEWFGWLFDGTFPYVYHATQGWQYQIVDPQGNIALYDYGLAKWVWTSQSFYPFYWAYDGEDSGWVYYERESQTPDRWFYDYNTEEWIQEADFTAVP